MTKLYPHQEDFLKRIADMRRWPITERVGGNMLADIYSPSYGGYVASRMFEKPYGGKTLPQGRVDIEVDRYIAAMKKVIDSEFYSFKPSPFEYDAYYDKEMTPDAEKNLRHRLVAQVERKLDRDLDRLDPLQFNIDPVASGAVDKLIEVYLVAGKSPIPVNDPRGYDYPIITLDSLPMDMTYNAPRWDYDPTMSIGKTRRQEDCSCPYCKAGIPLSNMTVEMKTVPKPWSKPKGK